MMPNVLAQPQAPALGELVVLSGKQTGVRRALTAPVMFLGRAMGCDVRLNVEGLEPFHCVIGVKPGEVTLRDLNSGIGTFVNGQRISAALLRDGDILDVGPFRFRVLVPAATSTTAEALEPAQRDALRIQAAAVAAQQAALDEQEGRLADATQALDAARAEFQRWSAERADELDAGRAELERERAEARAANEREREALRLDLQRQRAALAEELQQERFIVMAELEQAREQRRVELEQARQTASVENVGAVEQTRNADEQLAAAHRRLSERTARLEQLRVELQYKEGALALQQVRLNTQREIDSRLLHDGWRCLERDQQRWRQRRTREHLALRVRQVLLVEEERRLVGRRAEIAREQHAWLTQRHQLESELHGLNSRVVHQRQLLEQQETARRALIVAAPGDETAEPAPLVEPALATRSAELERLAGELGDQRALLLEQWERLTRLQQDWQTRRDEAAAELEAVGEHLVRIDESLTQREQQLETAEARLRQEQEQLDTLRRHAALALARSEAQRHAFESERTELVDTTTGLSAQAQRQLEALGGLRRKWNQRRQEETQVLRRERQAVAQRYDELLQARQELVQQAQLLESARRTLAEEATALTTNAEDPQLRRRWLQLNAGVVHALRKQREALQRDLERWSVQHAELTALAAELTQARTATSAQQSELDERAVLLAADQAALVQQQRDAQQRQAALERQLAALQEDRELMARSLIPDGAAPTTVLDRAA